MKLIKVLSACAAMALSAFGQAGEAGSTPDHGAVPVVSVPPGSDREVQTYAPPNPSSKSDGSGKVDFLTEDMDYEIGNTGVVVTVPAGFVTDFASIPQALWSFGLTPRGTYGRAAIIHDYLYWSQVCTKEQSDHIMVLAMHESNVSGTEQFLLEHGVEFGARPAWDANRKEREALMPRIIPPKYRKPNGNLVWAEIRAELQRQGVMDPPFPGEAAYCVLGNSTVVPIDPSRPYNAPAKFQPVMLATMAASRPDFRFVPYGGTDALEPGAVHRGPYLYPPAKTKKPTFN